ARQTKTIEPLLPRSRLHFPVKMSYQHKVTGICAPMSSRLIRNPGNQIPKHDIVLLEDLEHGIVLLLTI
ncbi:MAG: hypothetical protein AAFY15_07225, partial [Cyanobacteria bacterium J06648_11]